MVMSPRPHALKIGLQIVTRSGTAIGLTAEAGQWLAAMIAETVRIAGSESMTTGSTHVMAIMNRAVPTMEVVIPSSVILV